MNVEAAIWVWIYMGMAAGLFSIAVIVWAILFEHSNKE